MTEAEARTVEVGVPFTVEIPSTPTTGYRWVADDVPAGVELLDSAFRARPDGRPGDGGTAVFTLVVHAPGGYRIELALQRPWEQVAVETHSVDLHAT